MTYFAVTHTQEKGNFYASMVTILTFDENVVEKMTVKNAQLGFEKHQPERFLLIFFFISHQLIDWWNFGHVSIIIILWIK